jgi:hypothetical protein
MDTKPMSDEPSARCAYCGGIDFTEGEVPAGLEFKPHPTGLLQSAQPIRASRCNGCGNLQFVDRTPAAALPPSATSRRRRLNILLPRRRWFKFSLRSLFVLVTCSCVLSCWLCVQMKWIYDRHRELESLQSRAGVSFRTAFRGTYIGPPAPWSIRILGENGVTGIVIWKDSGQDERAEEQRLKKLFPEANVHMHPAIPVVAAPAESIGLSWND